MVKSIKTLLALDEIFYTNNYEYLQEQIFDAEEVEFTDNEYEIILKNNKNFNKNLYTDISENSSLVWLGIYDENEILSGLQLIDIQDDYIELIVIAKNTNHNVNFSIFDDVIKYCKETYKRNIITFPLNDALKHFYKKFGFTDNKTKEEYIELIYK